MTLTRRKLLRAALQAGALAAVPRPLLARLGAHWEPVPPVQDPRIKALALRAIEAARAAGAAYADVRLTHTRGRVFASPLVEDIHDSESLAVGVRALVDGYWGFAGSPVWDVEESARLGREAVHQAKVYAAGGERTVTLAPAPAVKDGHWEMPVASDPLEVSPLEIVDYLAGLFVFVRRFPDFSPEDARYIARVQDKAFASSEGSYCTQRLYRSEGAMRIALLEKGQKVMIGNLDTLTPAGLGWELFRDQPMQEQLRRLMEQMKEDWTMPEKPVEVGRYDTVLDAWSVAQLLDRTLGQATQLDRAMGFEANAGGTSYLTDPVAMLGTFRVGAPALAVTANRSEPGGAATIAWDDEGVAPETFPLVRDGVLADLQTTRESAQWLREPYAKRRMPLRSHGCAAAPSALEAPLGHTPNLALAPGRESRDFDALVAELSTGVAIRGMEVDLDFQGQSGLGLGRMYEVKRGKRTARLAGAGVLFRATELWKNLLAVGGARSARRYGMHMPKGEPPQSTDHSVTAAPAVFKQLTVVDVMRKA